MIRDVNGVEKRCERGFRGTKLEIFDDDVKVTKVNATKQKRRATCEIAIFLSLTWERDATRGTCLPRVHCHVDASTGFITSIFDDADISD